MDFETFKPTNKQSDFESFRPVSKYATQGALPDVNTLHGLATSPAVSATLGFGDEVRRGLSQLLGFPAEMITGQNPLKEFEQPAFSSEEDTQNPFYRMGTFGGAVAPYLMGGGALEAAAGKISPALLQGGRVGSAIRGGLGLGTYGALTGENRGEEALMGLFLPAVAEAGIGATKLGFKGGKALFDMIRHD